MVQKEVMKKTQAYGLLAILMASVFVALIYTYGTSPGIPEYPQASPTASPNPPPNFNTQTSPMNTFESIEELKGFLNTNIQTGQNTYYFRSDTLGQPAAAPTAVPPMAASEAATKDYSTTNIQVEGVDEADTVKTDGNYLYVIANNSVYILDADPQNARVIRKITLENTSLTGIYLSENGNKLAVLGNNYNYYVYTRDSPATSDIMIYPYYHGGSTFAYIYDVSNKNSPQLTRNFTMTGNYFNSRMIGDYLYTIVTEYAYLLEDSVILPIIYTSTAASEIDPTDIYYTNVTKNPDDSSFSSYASYSYTTFVALNINDDSQEINDMTIMLSGADNLYVSQNNIYITYPVFEWQEIQNDIKTIPEPSNEITIMPEPMIAWLPSTVKTAVYRIYIDGSSMTFAANGNITGTVLNQYSMDEYNGYFRVATTGYDYELGKQQNNVYILNPNMETVGKLENLAPGENFHAARFMGNRCYLVTFLNTDPLFVIDVSQPSNPTVLGELIIPGYSDYLHPYDETHLIGLGKDAIAVDDNFAYYQGLKLSLFDVSNVNDPKETDKIIIGDRGTNSEALYEPKAFLFERSKDLLVIPVQLYLINDSGETALKTPEIIQGRTPPVTETGPSAYGTFRWQGIYVFEVTLNGFEIKGNVTQLSEEILSNLAQNDNYWSSDNGYNYWIHRAIYIEDVLYTFSESRVQLNNVNNFELIAEIELN